MNMSARSSLIAALIAAAVVGSTLVGGTSAAAPGESGARWSGEAALVRLGSRLPSVAAEHGMTVAQLRSEFLGDASLFVDATDRLLFVDPPAPAGVTSGPDAVYDPLPSTSDAFSLHSKPGSSRTILLDFDGHLLSGTAWNNKTGGDCMAEPYDADSAPSTFSSTERNVIISVWKRMAEDFAPFDVDVTTQDPGYAAINRASTSDAQYGTRLIVTRAVTPCPSGTTLYTALCSTGCGGIAYVGVFDNTGTAHDTYQPAIVFQNGVGSGAKNIAEAGSHEVGHNIGLSHDGTSTVGYYRGHGDWAPIMGVGYYEAITQWSKGEYLGANQLQDDFVVAGNNGLLLRADDHGDTSAAATALTGPSVSVFGVITRASDVDAFTVPAGAGPATFTVAPAPTSPDLDIRLEVRDASGLTIAVADPTSGSTNSDSATGLGATITTTLPTAGVYTVLVDGVGKGDPLTDGYSDYGSVGNYQLTGDVVSSVGTAPLAVITSTPATGTAPLVVTFDATASSDADGDTLTYAWDFGTGGATAATPTASFTYTTAGTYTVLLSVTDSTGLSNTATTTITVSSPVRRIDVASMAISATRAKPGVTALATVTVRDADGVAVGNATVSGRWTIGAKTGAITSAVTATNGGVTFRSANNKVAAGTSLTFCVTGLTLGGATWDPTLTAPATANDCVTTTAP